MTGRRGGFTLLELLIATALAAVLMTGIWSLLSMYNRLFEKGQSKAEQAQLVRAMFGQLTDDLHAAIQDPIAGRPTETRGPVAVRRFGLLGSATELEFDVLQITPFGGSLTPTDETDYTTVRTPLRAPELRTVYYHFNSSQTASGSEPSSQPGLSRRELDFETPFDEDDSADGLAGLSNDSPSQAGPDDELAVVDPNDDSVMLAPEVVKCRFRYFDGSTWATQWNSLTRKSLPVAVEVTVEVSTLDDRRQEIEDELSGEIDPAEALDDAGPSPQLTDNPVYRLVIDVPGAPMHKEPRRVRRTAIDQLRQRAATRYRPRLVPRDQSQPASLPDERFGGGW